MRFWAGKTLSEIFGLSNESVNSLGERSSNCESISLLVTVSAVAVNAIMGTVGKVVFN